MDFHDSYILCIDLFISFVFHFYFSSIFFSL